MYPEPCVCKDLVSCIELEKFDRNQTIILSLVTKLLYVFDVSFRPFRELVIKEKRKKKRKLRYIIKISKAKIKSIIDSKLNWRSRSRTSDTKMSSR